MKIVKFANFFKNKLELLNCLLLILVTVFITQFACIEVTGQEAGNSSNHQVIFVTTTLEKIVSSPQKVLEDEEKFWKEETVQLISQSWIDEVGVRNARERWRRKISALTELTEAERKENNLLKMTDSIKEKKAVFQEKAIPHLFSYLPVTDKILNMPVYFTAFIPPRAFANTAGIVVDVAASYWKGNPDNIINCLIHELFHIGYSWYRPSRTEEMPEHKFLYTMLEYLQNEGLATYVGYKALPMFPAPDEKDYQLLESEEEVSKRIKEINYLFEKAGTMSNKKLKQLAWRKGVNGRAYYIAGAHMAQVVENGLGRKMLIQTINQGPISYVKVYNSLAPEDRKIFVPDDETITARQDSCKNFR